MLIWKNTDIRSMPIWTYKILQYVLKNIKRKLQTRIELFIKEDHKIVKRMNNAWIWALHILCE